MSADEAKELGLPETKSNRHRITLDQESELKRIRSGFSEYCKESGIDQSDVSAYWDKSDKYSILVRPNISKDEITPEYIKEIVSNIDFKPQAPATECNSDEILRIIITDVHVGMETDESGYGLYKQVWNESELFKRMDVILSEVNRIKRDFKEVHVIDLGDYLDGWNGLTTRGGHGLPQNMSNRKAFKVGVKFKVELYNKLQYLLGCNLVAYNVCNDNHSSDFAFVVNETVKQVSELSNQNIEVNNLQRFISHYTYGKHCFILCHGKDEAHMKFGLKPKLDPVAKEKIMEYIRYYNIDSEFVTFEKGDSHQQLLDSTSSENFEYFNYRALSPASSWVKHNFKLGTNGFTMMTVRADKKSKGIEAIEF